MQRASLAQVSARLHGHIYRSRSCTRRRLDLIRSRQKTPIHAIEFNNIICFPYLVIFSLKLECVLGSTGFIQSIFNKKRMEITRVFLTPFPAENGVRFVAVPTAVGTRFAVCHFSKMRRFIARLLRPSDYSFNTS